jgi:hypothetical protein
MNSTVLSIIIIFGLAFVYEVHSSMLNIAGHNIFDENEEIESLADSKCPNGAKLGKGNKNWHRKLFLQEIMKKKLIVFSFDLIIILLVCKMSAQCGKRGFCRLTTEPGKGKGKKTKHCCEHSADVNNLVCFKNKKNGKDVKPSKIGTLYKMNRFKLRHLSSLWLLPFFPFAFI